jgi:hypothetical protein
MCHPGHARERRPAHNPEVALTLFPDPEAQRWTERVVELVDYRAL